MGSKWLKQSEGQEMLFLGRGHPTGMPQALGGELEIKESVFLLMVPKAVDIKKKNEKSFISCKSIVWAVIDWYNHNASERG